MSLTKAFNPYEFNFQHLFLIFILGCIIGPIGDALHVFSGTTDYPQQMFGLYFWRLPFWVPLLFGSAAVFIALSHAQADVYLLKRHKTLGPLNPRMVFLGVIALIFHYGVSGFLPWQAGGISDVMMAAGAFLIWYGFERTWQGLVAALLTAFCGTSFEIFLTSTGAFWYTEGADNLFGVASWLPWIYVSASVVVGNMGRCLALRTSQPQPISGPAKTLRS